MRPKEEKFGWYMNAAKSMPLKTEGEDPAEYAERTKWGDTASPAGEPFPDSVYDRRQKKLKKELLKLVSHVHTASRSRQLDLGLSTCRHLYFNL